MWNATEGRLSGVLRTTILTPLYMENVETSIAMLSLLDLNGGILFGKGGTRGLHRVTTTP